MLPARPLRDVGGKERSESLFAKGSIGLSRSGVGGSFDPDLAHGGLWEESRPARARLFVFEGPERAGVGIYEGFTFSLYSGIWQNGTRRRALWPG